MASPKYKYRVNWWDLDKLNNYFVLKFPKNRQLVEEAVQNAPGVVERLIKSGKVEVFDDNVWGETESLKKVGDLGEFSSACRDYELFLHLYEKCGLGGCSKGHPEEIFRL